MQVAVEARGKSIGDHALEPAFVVVLRAVILCQHSLLAEARRGVLGQRRLSPRPPEGCRTSQWRE